MLLTPSQIRDIFRRYQCCIVIPTYNNNRTLAAVINGCLEYCGQVMVINDGSTDHTREILENYPEIKIVHHETNQGKGIALKNALKEAEKAGYAYIITIDSDGQHDPGDLAVFAAALQEEQGPIYIGARNMGQSNIPGKSKFGHKNSNFWFWVETGIPAQDTQSGYRLYPVKPLYNIPLVTRRYEFEIEIIVRAAWKDIPVKFIPVRVYYPENRVSHFRPFRDFMRVAFLNVFLVVAAWFWFRPVQMIRQLKKKSLREIWRDHILKPGESPTRKAFAVAVGLFSGISPFWGFHTAIAIGLAFIFRLNKPLTLLASNISIPPMIPLVLYLSFGVGGIITGAGWGIDVPGTITFEVIQQDIIRYIAGSIALSLIVAAIGGILTWWAAFAWSKKRKQHS